MTEHFRMSGMYWGLTAMDILGQLDKMSRSEVVQFIRQCQDAESGGFSASLGHDPHMLFTLSAVQVLCCPVPVLWLILCNLSVVKETGSRVRELNEGLKERNQRLKDVKMKDDIIE